MWSHRADALEHVEHRLVRAAMRRTPQRRHAGGNRRIGIGAGAAGKAHRRGAGVLFVVGMQDEQQIERLGGDRIDRVAARREPRRTCSACSRSSAGRCADR